MTTHLHHVHHKHVAGEGVESWITCDGGRHSACHFYPAPDPDDPYRWADGWTVAEHFEHGVPHDECVHVANAEAWSCAMLCAPDGEPVRNGPIIPSWNGDCMVWEYADTEEPHNA